MFLSLQSRKLLAVMLLFVTINAPGQTGSSAAKKPAASAAAKAAPAPKISIAQPEFNFGEVREGTDLSHTFLIKIEGNAPLEIKSVAPS
jgi:hypothetical protein